MCTHFVPGKQEWWESCGMVHWGRRKRAEVKTHLLIHSGAVFLVTESASFFLTSLHGAGVGTIKRRFGESVYKPKNFAMPFFFFILLLISPTELMVPKLSFRFLSYSWYLNIHLFNTFQLNSYHILNTLLGAWNKSVYKTKWPPFSYVFNHHLYYIFIINVY